MYSVYSTDLQSQERLVQELSAIIDNMTEAKVAE